MCRQTYLSYRTHKSDDFQEGNDNWKAELILNVSYPLPVIRNDRADVTLNKDKYKKCINNQQMHFNFMT